MDYDIGSIVMLENVVFKTAYLNAGGNKVSELEEEDEIEIMCHQQLKWIDLKI